MFKSIQWRILTLFILLTVSVMTFVGVFSSWGISKYYNRQFAEDMTKNTFTDSMVSQLEGAASSSFLDMTKVLSAFSVRMGIDSYREAYVLSGEDASCLYSLSGKMPENLSITANIIAALSGKTGSETDETADYMDFAMPVKTGGRVSYIIYVRDSKVEMYEVMKSILKNIFLALLIGLGISVLLGFVLSKTLIRPLIRLENSASHMAKGNFTDKIKVSGEDEIGSLTKAFNHMAEELNFTMNEMASEKNKIETVLSYMTDGVVAFNSDGKLIHINPAAMRLLDITEESVGSFDEFFKKLKTNINMGQFLYMAKEPAEMAIDYSGRHFMVYLAPIESEEKVTGVVSVFQDYTKQQKLENARREFVANVSHELRTPITVIKSYTETLMDYREHDETEENFLSVIDGETDRMTRLIADLLALSRLDNGNDDMRKAPFDLAALLRLACERMGVEAKKRLQTIEEHINVEAPFITGDRGRIEQVIVNIIGNAVKYTPEGGKVEVFGFSDENNAYIKVKDNGIGIPKADIPHIFERFYRVDKARSRSAGGTGLGLAIAKEIVDAHGGSIGIESEEGKGTTVTVTLPIKMKTVPEEEKITSDNVR